LSLVTGDSTKAKKILKEGKRIVRHHKMDQPNSVVPEVYLLPWCEFVGIYRGLFIKDDRIHLTISDNILSFLKDSVEAKVVQERLNDFLVGRKIAILRTDEPEKPLCIRLVD
jgi:hypothetical protein